jgi:hypothetical protein
MISETLFLDRSLKLLATMSDSAVVVMIAGDKERLDIKRQTCYRILSQTLKKPGLMDNSRPRVKQWRIYRQ